MDKDDGGKKKKDGGPQEGRQREEGGPAFDEVGMYAVLFLVRDRRLGSPIAAAVERLGFAGFVSVQLAELGSRQLVR